MACSSRSTAARHAGQLERIVQVIERGMKELPGEVRIGKAAQAQQPRHRRMQIERRRKSRRCGVVARQMLPDERLHAPRSWRGSASSGSGSPCR